MFADEPMEAMKEEKKEEDEDEEDAQEAAFMRIPSILRQLGLFWQLPWAWNSVLDRWHTIVLPMPAQALVPCLDFPDAPKDVYPGLYMARLMGEQTEKDYVDNAERRSYYDKIAIAYRIKQLREQVQESTEMKIKATPAIMQKHDGTALETMRRQLSRVELNSPQPAMAAAGRMKKWGTRSKK